MILQFIIAVFTIVGYIFLYNQYKGSGGRGSGNQGGGGQSQRHVSEEERITKINQEYPDIDSGDDNLSSKANSPNRIVNPN